MADEKFVIGDTIQLKATIKNYAGTETAPAVIGVFVKQLDGTILSSGTPSLSTGTTAQYYYNYTVSTGLTSDTRLAVVWEWSGPHKKKILFNVIPIM